MCPGLDGDLLRDLRRADIRTGPSSVSRSYINEIYIIFLKAEHQKRFFSPLLSGRPGFIRHRGARSEMLNFI